MQNIQRLKSSHEKFPVRARRDAAHKFRAPIASWTYKPTVKVIDGVECIVASPVKLVRGIAGAR